MYENVYKWDNLARDINQDRRWKKGEFGAFRFLKVLK